MARRKLISDVEVLDIALSLFARDGEKGVSFGTVGKATGLAPATLVQRFVSSEALFSAMISQSWTNATVVIQRCDEAMVPNGQNAVAFLKGLEQEVLAMPMGALLVASRQNPILRAKASDWRRAVEASLQGRIEKRPNQAAESAAALFAAWQGRLLWSATEGGEFRLRAILKKKLG